MPRPKKYPDELIRRGVRLAIESGRPVRHVAADLGIDHETLRRHVRQAGADGGLRPDLPTSEEREEITQLRKYCPIFCFGPFMGNPTKGG
jgi:transposase